MDRKIKARVIRRLKIIEGQVRGLQKMVQQEKYCIDVIHQSLAVKQALSGVEDLMLENHLSTHVIEQMKSGRQKQAAEEILAVYKLSKKKF
ncbi:MAG: metal-sensing transcriptional repressor [Patescibacteria group bacterium]